MSFIQKLKPNSARPQVVTNTAKLAWGLDFTKEVYATIVRIRQYPETWPFFSTLTRRCLRYRYPYALLYQVTQDMIQIVAVAHLHRKPGYWEDRLE